MCILISTRTICYDYLFVKRCSVGCVYATISNQFFGNPFVRSNIYPALTIKRSSDGAHSAKSRFIIRLIKEKKGRVTAGKRGFSAN